jgi:hypothetical protein
MDTRLMSRKFVLIVAMMLAASESTACNSGEDNAKNIDPDADCVELLRGIESLEMKISWTECSAPRMTAVTENPPADSSAADMHRPPPPPPPLNWAPDAAHCRLLDPSSPTTDTCLVKAMSLVAESRSDPRCPGMITALPLADLAFFVLVDRHPGLWERALPASIATSPATAYHDWVAFPENRTLLIENVKQVLQK